MDSRILIGLLVAVIGACLILHSEARCYIARKDITCQSWGYRYATCRAQGPVVFVSLKKQLSRTTCRRAANFGHYSNNVWVSHGCRAMFSVSYRKCTSCHLATSIMECSSWGYRYKSCRAPGPVRGLSVHKQLSRSACIPRYSYGSGRSYIYVNHGCRAYFRVTYTKC